MLRLKQILAAFLLCMLSVFSYTPTVQGAEAASPNYGVSEVNFNSGGLLQACSAAYCTKQTTGETAVGLTTSTNYQARGGANTEREPLLEMSVSSTTISLGILDALSTKSGSTTFSVRTFPAHGYVVKIDGTSPKNKTDGHVLAPMASSAVSSPGVEQFGINLIANTSPAVGSNPSLFPDSTFAFGAAATGYATPNSFKYVPGEIIAQSAKGTGKTNFTISTIANIATNTPGGDYRGRLVLIAVPTF
jgi:hypothetical protein